MEVIIDFGLVVLVWMVQLVIYPSFLYYEEQNLIVWHKRYTTAITFVVLPLMLGQLILHALDVMVEFTWVKLILMAMIIATWLITFFSAVPSHQNITKGLKITQAVKSLIYINWYRTALWTLIFLLQLFLL